MRANYRNSSVPHRKCILNFTEMKLDEYNLLQQQMNLGPYPAINILNQDNENNSNDNLLINQKNDISQNKLNSMIGNQNQKSETKFTNYYAQQKNANFEGIIAQEQKINPISTENFVQKTKKIESQLQSKNENLKEDHNSLQLQNQKISQQSPTQYNSPMANMEYEKFLRENLPIVFKPLTKALQLYQVIIEKNGNEKQDLIIDQKNQVVLILQLNKIKYFEQDQKIKIETKYDNNYDGESYKIIFNQHLNKNCYQILNDQSRMLNSSIIDAYATYLNQEDEKLYFSLEPEHRERYQRLYIFTSDFINNCTIDDYKMDKDIKQVKWIYLFLEKLTYFKRIQYQFQIIYSKIVFVYNLGGFHWCVAEIQLNHQLIIIYDSLFSYPNINLEKFMNQIFSLLLKKPIQFKTVYFPDFIKQQDGHSCGYYSCIALKYISDPKVRKQFVTKEEIIKELREKLL